VADNANLLGGQNSPYLLQHAANPVNWRPWGRDALEEARQRHVPVLLSVGYAACHWCHVMAHESFEDPATAEVMNRLFVNIKVDREERPDIDHLYMSALQAMGEQGGWPLTMFLDADGEPFWGGTYFPPEPRWGRPSFRQVLEAVAAAWRDRHDMVRRNAASLAATLRELGRAPPGNVPAPADLDRLTRGYLRLTDPEHGGMRGAPKFPNAPIFRFLWLDYARSGRAASGDAVRLLLRRMALGGIYDHLGGGFARYATDSVWLVPHFEKMLYDNAQLLELMTLAHADAPDKLLASRVEQTIDWLRRDMIAAENGACLAAFAASEDADSEGEEGRFYVWSAAEIERRLGPDAAAFMRAYDVSEAGNWEGNVILRRLSWPLSDAEEAALAAARARLLAARAARHRPGRDDKVLADWNGLTIAALAKAACVFDRADWLNLAERAFDFIQAEMISEDGRVAHAWRLGRISAAGMLDDHAAMARAALALHEATGDAARFGQARTIVGAALAAFGDADGSLFTTAEDATDVPLTRLRVATESATPSGIGMMAEVFARFWHLTGEAAWRHRATALIGAFSGAGERLAAMPTLMAAAGILEDGGSVVVIAGPNRERARQLSVVARASADPSMSVIATNGAAELPPDHPAHGKTAGPAGAAAFVCRGGVCGMPVSEPHELAVLLRRSGADGT